MTGGSDQILDEATDWLLLLQEKPADPGEKQRFEQWLAADPRHGEVWRELSRSYDLIGSVEPELADKWRHHGEARLRRSGWFRFRARGQAAPRARKTGRKVAVAASVALLAAWSAPTLWLDLVSDYSTAPGQMKVITLADGSKAQLGPDSAMRIGYEAGERRIELLAGQALFEVKPDKARPFRVVAGDVTTTVLGTGFDVRRLPSATEVGVRHGRVRVDGAAGRPYVLGAGDQIAIAQDGQARSEAGSPLLVAAWAHSEVNARDKTVADVIDEIRPWYAGKIIVLDGKLASRRVNGVYNPLNVTQALRSMVSPLGGKVLRITPWLLVVTT